MAIFLTMIKYHSTKWWLLFVETTNWHSLGEIQVCVVLALCEIAIRWPITCQKWALSMIGLWELSNLCLSPNQILLSHTTYWTLMCAQLCKLHLFHYLMTAYSMPVTKWELHVGNKWTMTSTLKEICTYRNTYTRVCMRHSDGTKKKTTADTSWKQLEICRKGV